MRRAPQLSALSFQLFLLLPAVADDAFWDCEDGGTFDSNGCWSAFAAPGPDDAAVFDIGGVYTVLFDEEAVTDRVLVRSGLVTFDLSEAGYGLLNESFTAPSIVVGETVPTNAGLTVGGGSLVGRYVDLGLDATAFGMLDVVGAGAELESQMQLSVGRQGIGVLTLADGGSILSARGAIGAGSSGTGVATLTGPGTQWLCTGPFDVAGGGFALLTVANGAALETGDAAVALLPGSWASAAVRGPGSAWAVAGALDVGFWGQASLDVSDGATVSTVLFATIGTASTGFVEPLIFGEGTVTVHGPGSLLDVGGDLFVGLFGVGHLVLSEGGRVEAGGDVSVNFQSFLSVELAGPDDYAEPAVAAGGAADELPVTVTLLDGFEPEAGDAFAIVEAAGGLGQVTFDLPPLPEPLEWFPDQDPTSVVLRVAVPAPGDANGDGVVDVDDLIAVILAWGPCPAPPAICPADLDGDFQVDVDDLVDVVLNWG